MKAVAIINPKAGSGTGVQLPVDTVILQTKAPGHAIELTRDALKRGARTIFAVGGDGTVNEVVNGLFENEEPLATDAELVVIPRGTGSDFSRVLKLSPRSTTMSPSSADIGTKRISPGE